MRFTGAQSKIQIQTQEGVVRQVEAAGAKEEGDSREGQIPLLRLSGGTQGRSDHKLMAGVPGRGGGHSGPVPGVRLDRQGTGVPEGRRPGTGTGGGGRPILWHRGTHQVARGDKLASMPQSVGRGGANEHSRQELPQVQAIPDASGSGGVGESSPGRSASPAAGDNLRRGPEQPGGLARSPTKRNASARWAPLRSGAPRDDGRGPAAATDPGGASATPVEPDWRVAAKEWRGEAQNRRVGARRTSTARGRGGRGGTTDKNGERKKVQRPSKAVRSDAGTGGRGAWQRVSSGCKTETWVVTPPAVRARAVESPAAR